ncbi:prepilin-type N-terminal cleavage/methylation domain-containing protein [Solibacillus sp. CAU 1738]|uniref:prepilin-type N-terminal cleavage/methylation domain-containing protein n=1 Tax=Solibacillus sp. CAU 1738 TaxID=3140363 RepID=UPI0032619EE9
MFKEMKKRIKNEKGLTLVELLAVIVILAIVAAIAIPAIGNIINNQRDKAVLADVSGVISAAKIANTDGSCGTGNVCGKDDLADYISVKGFKATGDQVDLTTVTDPEIKYTLASGEEIKAGGKMAKALGKAYAVGDVLTIKESKLNEVMGK